MVNFIHIILGALVLWLIYYLITTKMKQDAALKTSINQLNKIPLDLQSEIALAAAAVELQKKDNALAKATQTTDPVERAKLLKQAKQSEKSAEQSAKAAIIKVKQAEIKQEKSSFVAIQTSHFASMKDIINKGKNLGKDLGSKAKDIVKKVDVKKALEVAKAIGNPELYLLNLVLGSTPVKKFICKEFKIFKGNLILNNQDIVLSFVKCITMVPTCPATLLKLSIKIAKKIALFEILKKASEKAIQEAKNAETKATADIGTPNEKKSKDLALKLKKVSDVLTDKVKKSCLTCGKYDCAIINGGVSSRGPSGETIDPDAKNLKPNGQAGGFGPGSSGGGRGSLSPGPVLGPGGSGGGGRLGPGPVGRLGPDGDGEGGPGVQDGRQDGAQDGDQDGAQDGDQDGGRGGSEE